MAPRKGSRALGAARAGGFHVKTGCITCKIRHVKCDEAKPECNKCTSTGRKCDGYMAKQDPSPPPPPPAEQQGISSWRATSGSIDMISFDLSSWKGTNDELRAFDYFRVQTSEDLAYSLNASLEELVLQTSHHHEAIKHAAIALGSLGYTLRCNSASPSGPWSALWRHQFAHSQYFKAVRLLQRNIDHKDKDSVNFALISCFLFLVFEFLQGNDPSAVTHLRCGLNILRQQYPAHVDGRIDEEGSSVMKLDPIHSTIAHIFNTIDSQAVMWLDLRASNRRSYHLENTISQEMVFEPYGFLDDAAQHLSDLTTRIYNFRRLASRHDFAPTRADVPASIYSQRNSLLDQLDIHSRRLGAYLTCRQAFCQQPEDPHRITVLRINRKVTTVMLSTYLEPEDCYLYAQSQPQFWQIVSLATLILRPKTSEPRQKLSDCAQSKVRPLGNGDKVKGPGQRQIFSFVAGLIQPLYYTAIKCPDQGTAMKAIALLEMKPWCEGSWDSAAMAKEARVRLLEPGRWRWSIKATGVDDSGIESGGAGLCNEWPLATDPMITYPA
ncbi:MAG: hypothetical protein Q9170_007299 [Blastenia crenularia]